MGGKKRRAEAQKSADEAEQLETLGQSAGALSAYRPHMQQALNSALQQQLSAFSGTNSLLEQMGLQGFGEGSQYGNVVNRDMMEVGQTSQAPGWADGKGGGGAKSAPSGDGTRDTGGGANRGGQSPGKGTTGGSKGRGSGLQQQRRRRGGSGR